MTFNTPVPAFAFLIFCSSACRVARLAVVMCLCLVAGHGLIAQGAGNGSWPIERGASDRPLPVNCVFLGNSLVEAGCDVPTFVAAWPKRAGAMVPLNLALAATTPEDHGLILQRTLELPVHLKYLIYGFVDDQLTAPVPEAGLDHEGRPVRSFPEAPVASYAPRPPMRWLHAGATGRPPLLTMRSSLWDEVERLRRSLDDNAREADDIASFDRRCEAIMAANPGFSPSVTEIIQLAREHGATVILVEMPAPARHRQIFHESPVWQRMHRYMQSLAWEEGAVFLKASDWVRDDAYFADATHLNAEGAKRFSARLAATLSRLETVPLVNIVSR